MNPHISEEYDAELDSARALLMEMGGLVEQQLRKACEAFVNHDAQLADEVSEGDEKVNSMEVELDELCIHIIARRQPAATDLRTLISVMNASTDLERIGDEADRIAKLAREIAHLPYPADQYSDFRAVARLTESIVSNSLDAFARLDPRAAVTVIEADEAIDTAYKEIVHKRGVAIREDRDELSQALNVMWAARALERIGDHAKNLGEYVVYLVKGRDVRHGDAAQAVAED